MVAVVFSVSCEKLGDEIVFLVGGGNKLGNWNPANGIALTSSDKCNWNGCVNLDSNASYSYRYFIGRYSKKHREKRLDLVRWESHKVPRQFTTDQGKEMSLPQTTFGTVSDIHSVSKGWLLDFCEVHIRFHDNPITMRSFSEEPKRVKCVAMDYTPSQIVVKGDLQKIARPETDLPLVSNLSSPDSSQPRCQDVYGELLSDKDYVVFRHRTFDLALQGFSLEILKFDTKAEMGVAHILPENLPESQCTLRLPIINCNGLPVGSILVDLLVARPTPDLTLDMETCDRCYDAWRQPDHRPLDVGHRGMGPSYSIANNHAENTVESFQAARHWGADFIETDIVLTKDECPVIFHDFDINVGLSNKADCEKSSKFHNIPIPDLTLEQLTTKRFYTSKGIEINGQAIDGSKGSLFPTLVQILTEVDEELGFNLEIKYPQYEETGALEAVNFPDMNRLLDVVLRIVYQFAGRRRIVFSTFHGDVCSLLNVKQSRFPVMFLSQGETKMYTPFRDFRATSFDHAINFAMSEEIMGLVFHTEVILEDMSVVSRVLDCKLLLFVWGNHNNDTKCIRQMRELGVDAVIYDRMDLYKPENISKQLNGESPSKNQRTAD